MPATQDPPPTGGGTDVLERTAEVSSLDQPWQTLLWNDPVNTTQFVTLTLMDILDITRDTAERLMLLTHTEGRTSVKQGPKDTCLVTAQALGAAGLWATMQKVS